MLYAIVSLEKQKIHTPLKNPGGIWRDARAHRILFTTALQTIYTNVQLQSAITGFPVE